MNATTSRRLAAQLSPVISTWLEDLDTDLLNQLPYLPQDIEDIMAMAAVTVLEILDAGEQRLREGGMLADE